LCLVESCNEEKRGARGVNSNNVSKRKKWFPLLGDEKVDTSRGWGRKKGMPRGIKRSAIRRQLPSQKAERKKRAGSKGKPLENNTGIK